MPVLPKYLCSFPFLHNKRLVNLVLQKKGETESRPYRIRTCDTLIKKQRRRVPPPTFLEIFLKISVEGLDKIKVRYYNKLK